ncbi:radical SAM protein [Streptomyces bobili]|uniref:Radical SAM protein n=1 Tax=Streptomyces bobili TaxID=67280 RepID=A0ABZ1RBL2_9ACTN|nr:radical SAM protein [Streptomyces bobili]
MRLAEIIELRPVPAAGLLATLTRRCPLSCAHCSTSSGPRGEDTPAEALRRFVGGFTAGDRPEVLMLTGGEPLLRPALVGDLAELAASAGTRTSVLSGMFFATEGPVPDRIMRALRHVAHFSASIDVFHEREVPRAAAFRAVHHIMDSGIDVSFHVVGNSMDDPYLADITASIRAEFRDQAAVLVNHVRQVGRAAVRTVPLPGAGEQAVEWAGEGAAAEGRPAPCAMAAWPVVGFDGTVTACCNQRVVDARPLPEHLRLGHIAVDDWPRIRRRCQESPVLRTIRTAGVGSCASCRTLARRPAALAAAERAGSRPAAGAMDALGARLQRDAGAAALLRRYGNERYAPLVLLDGRESGRGGGCGSGGDAGPGPGLGVGCGCGGDAGPWPGRGAGCGCGGDAGRGAGYGSSRDAGPETGREPGCGTSRETGDETSRRTGSADTHAPECGRHGSRESGREYDEGGGPA